MLAYFHCSLVKIGNLTVPWLSVTTRLIPLESRSGEIVTPNQSNVVAQEMAVEGLAKPLH